MTAMAVLSTRRTGHTLGALVTAVPGDPPSLEAVDSYRLQLLIGNVSHALTVERADLAVASLEAEFDDPTEVFGWRVATAPGPDGRPQPRLDRPSSTAVTITRGTAAAPPGTITVPRFGSLERLAFEVRNKDGLVDSGALTFASTDTTKSAPFTDPDPTAPIVVLVEGYTPQANP
jgi:hypothetical protein